MKIIFRFLTSAEKPMEIMAPFKRHVIFVTKGDADLFFFKIVDLF